MCTIMTTTVEKFTANEAAFLTQIRRDATTNDDGFALMLIGENRKQVSLTRSLDIESIIELLQAKKYTRFFLHCRAATTVYKGLSDSHGFVGYWKGDEWFVFHNGVFHHPESTKTRVDSAWLAGLITKYGPNAAMRIIQSSEAFANIFIVSPGAERFEAMHVSGGTLHYDNGESYSTAKMPGLIENPVKDDYWVYHKMPLPYPAFKSKYQSLSPYDPDAYDRANNLGKHRRTPPALPPVKDDTSITGEWAQIGGLWRRKIEDVTQVSLRKPKAVNA